MAAPTYNVMLHHLSADAKAAGVNFTNEPLLGVTPTQLRTLLHALGDLALRLTIYEPATPEIRIKTERSAFVVRTRHRRLCLVGWEAKLRGEEHSVSQILNIVTGATEPVRPAPEAERTGSASPVAGQPPSGSKSPITTGSTPPFAVAPAEPAKAAGLPRWAKISLLAVLIVGFNGTTAWLIFYRPGPTLEPKYQVLPDFESGALLAKAAGEYETGPQEGDRRLIIEPGGKLRLAKYGPERTILQETTRTAKGGQMDGRTVLISSDLGVIEIKDASTVVFFNTTYRRRNR